MHIGLNGWLTSETDTDVCQIERISPTLRTPGNAGGAFTIITHLGTQRAHPHQRRRQRGSQAAKCLSTNPDWGPTAHCLWIALSVSHALHSWICSRFLQIDLSVIHWSLVLNKLFSLTVQIWTHSKKWISKTYLQEAKWVTTKLKAWYDLVWSPLKVV